MRILRSLTTALVLICVSTLSQAADNNGFWVKNSDVTILDGDTLVADGRVVILSGIQALEIGQHCDHNGHNWSCGMAAALDLHKIIVMSRLEQLHCWQNLKLADWVEATCYVGEKDIAAAMIATGTVHARKGASVHYKMLQNDVQQGQVGIWGSEFIQPELWLRSITSATRSENCHYKAFTDKSGQKWFASPLLKGFQHLKAEHLFCSLETALEDGFRPLTDVNLIK